MKVFPRPYTGIVDLHKIQAVTAEWITLAGFSGYLHIGDIALRLFNGMRLYKPQDIVTLWENAHGELLGWGFVYPPWNSFQVAVHPDYRGSDLEIQMLEWGEYHSQAWLSREQREQPISLETYADDSVRIMLLEERGYTRTGQHGVLAERLLNQTIPRATLPDGFSIHRIQDDSESPRLVEVMNASFSWSWTTEDYLQVMHSPAYETGYSLVVDAPDKQFAAFCFVMLDRINRLGMFEDVGTHPNFRQMGLGRAMLFAGMQQMQAEGITSVVVPYEYGDNPQSKLYESVGFRPRYKISTYTKPN